MVLYEEVLEVADNMGLSVSEEPLQLHDGLICGKDVALRENIETDVEKSCVLAEEIGHSLTTVGDITDYSDQGNWKQEVRARTVGYRLMIQPQDIINAFEYGCRNRYEIAKYLEVTEEFLEDAIRRFAQIYGIYQRCGDYVITYEPCFGVIKFQT